MYHEEDFLNISDISIEQSDGKLYMNLSGPIDNETKYELPCVSLDHFCLVKDSGNFYVILEAELNEKHNLRPVHVPADLLREHEEIVGYDIKLIPRYKYHPYKLFL